MKIRTVFQPDLDQDVDEAEYEQLKREGLLLDDEPQPAAKTGATVTAAAPAKEATSDGGK